MKGYQEAKSVKESWMNCFIRPRKLQRNYTHRGSFCFAFCTCKSYHWSFYFRPRSCWSFGGGYIYQFPPPKHSSMCNDIPHITEALFFLRVLFLRVLWNLFGHPKNCGRFFNRRDVLPVADWDARTASSVARVGFLLTIKDLRHKWHTWDTVKTEVRSGNVGRRGCPVDSPLNIFWI